MIVRRVVGISTLALLVGAAFAAQAPAKAAGADDGKVLLRLRPEVGSEWMMTLEMTQDMDMSMGEAGSNAMVNETVMTARQVITAVSDAGNVTTEQTMERMRTEAKMGDSVVMSFDSAAPAESGPAAEQFEAMTVLIGKTIGVTASDRGEILSVEGFDEIWGALAPEDPMQQAVLEQLKSSFGEDMMRQQMQLYGVHFPEHALAAGDTWTYQLDMSNAFFGALVFDTNYLFKGIEVREEVECAIVGLSIEADLDFDFSALLAMMGAGEAGVDMSVEHATMSGSGELCVALDSGLSRHADANFLMEMRMAMGVGEETMEMAIDLDQNIVMRLDPASSVTELSSSQ